MPSVYASSVVNASIDQVWDRIRDFGELANWHPLIKECRIENDEPSEKIGCVRVFYLQDGSHLRERLVALNDFKYTFSYTLIESPLPIENYRATVKLTHVTDGDRTFIQWFSNFDCPAESEEEMSSLVHNAVYQDGINALKESLDR